MTEIVLFDSVSAYPVRFGTSSRLAELMAGRELWFINRLNVRPMNNVIVLITRHQGFDRFDPIFDNEELVVAINARRDGHDAAEALAEAIREQGDYFQSILFMDIERSSQTFDAHLLVHMLRLALATSDAPCFRLCGRDYSRDAARLITRQDASVPGLVLAISADPDDTDGEIEWFHRECAAHGVISRCNAHRAVITNPLTDFTTAACAHCGIKLTTPPTEIVEKRRNLWLECIFTNPPTTHDNLKIIDNRRRAAMVMWNALASMSRVENIPRFTPRDALWPAEAQTRLDILSRRTRISNDMMSTAASEMIHVIRSRADTVFMKDYLSFDPAMVRP